VKNSGFYNTHTKKHSARNSFFRLLCLSFLTLGLALGLSGCNFSGCNSSSGNASGNKPPMTLQAKVAKEGEILLFFTKNNGSNSVTEGLIRQIPEAEKSTAKAAPLAYTVQKLLNGPTEEEITQGFFSEIPKGTQLISVSEKGNGLRLNLNQTFTSGGGSNSMENRLAELTQTVLSVERKKPVYVDVEGQELQVLGGEGVMVQEPINQNTTQPQ
jgi:spore germination protein GerM